MKKIAIVLTIVIFLSSAIHVLREYRHAFLVKELNKEKLRNEALFAEKLSIEKKLNKTEIKILSLSQHKTAIDQDRIALLEANERQARSINWVEQGKKLALNENKRLTHTIDSLHMKILLMEKQHTTDQTRLQDTIRYLRHLSNTLTAELEGQQNR